MLFQNDGMLNVMNDFCCEHVARETEHNLSRGGLALMHLVASLKPVIQPHVWMAFLRADYVIHIF